MRKEIYGTKQAMGGENVEREELTERKIGEERKQ